MRWTLLRMALRMLRTKKKRLLTSILGAVLGIGLIVSLTALYDNMMSTIDQQVFEQYGPVDLVIGYREPGKQVDKEQLKKLQHITGVAETGNTLVNIALYYFDDRAEFRRTIYTAIDNSPLTLSNYKILKALALDEVVISRSLATQLGTHVNDSVMLDMPQRNAVKFKVSQILEDNHAKTNLLFFSMDRFEQMYGDQNVANPVLIDLTPEAKSGEVVQFIHSLIDRGIIVEQSKGLDEQQNIRNLKWMSYVFGGLTILAASMFVLSSFTLSIRERFRDLAMLRSIGASPRQIFGMVWMEAFLVGFIASIAGLVLGLGVSSWLYAFANRWVGLNVYGFKVPWASCTSVSVIGWMFIMIVAAIPAWRASRILPIELVRDSLTGNKRNSRGGLWISTAAIVLGSTVLVAGLFMSNETASGVRPLCILLGGLFVVLGMFCSLPWLFKPLIRVLGISMSWIVGPVSQIAVKNLIAERKQSVITIAVLALAPLLFFAIGVFLSSFQNSMESELRKQYLTDFNLSHRLGPASDLNIEFARQIKSIPDVKAAIPISFVEVARLQNYDYTRSDPSWRDVNGEKDGNYNMPKRELFTYKLVDLQQLVQMGYLPQSSGLNNMANQLYVTKEYAHRLGLHTGDHIIVERSGKTAELTVAAILDELPLIPVHSPQVVLVDWGQSALSTPNKGSSSLTLEKILLQAKEGKQAQAATELKAFVEDFKDLRLSDLNTEIINMKDQMLQKLVLLYAVTAVVWVIGLLGGMTTLSANLLTKRREFAILRAISITPDQLTVIVLLQSILFGTIAFVFGTAMGLFLSYSFAKALDAKYMVNINLTLWMVAGSVFCFLLTLIQPWMFSKKLGKETVTKALAVD